MYILILSGKIRALNSKKMHSYWQFKMTTLRESIGLLRTRFLGCHATWRDITKNGCERLASVAHQLSKMAIRFCKMAMDK